MCAALLVVTLLCLPCLLHAQYYMPAAGYALRFTSDKAKVSGLTVTPRCSTTNPFLSANYTIAAWVRPQGFAGVERAIAGFAFMNGPLLLIGRDLNILVEGSLTHTVCRIPTPAVTLADNVWYHVVWSETTMNRNVYLNGMVYSTCGRATTTYPNVVAQLNVGFFDHTLGSSNAQAMNGDMDDIRIYTRAFDTAAEVQRVIMNAPPSASDLANNMIMYFTFDEGQGIPVNHVPIATTVEMGNGLVIRSPVYVPSTAPIATNPMAPMIIEAVQDPTSGSAPSVSVELLVAIANRNNIYNATKDPPIWNASLTVTGVSGPGVTINGVAATQNLVATSADNSRITLIYTQTMGVIAGALVTMNVTLAIPGRADQTRTILIVGRNNRPPIGGNAGNAASLDGIRQYFISDQLAWPLKTVGTNTGLSAITIEFWAYTDPKSAGDSVIFSLNGNGEQQWNWVDAYNSQRKLGRWNLKLMSATGMIEWQVSGGGAVDGTKFYYGWHHYAFIHDGVEGTAADVYVNGVWVMGFTHDHDGQQSAPKFSTTGYNHVLLGSWSFWSEVYAYGVVDDFRLWNVRRTPAQIRNMMYTQLVGNEAGLYSYWDFNTITSAGIVVDRTINSHDLVAGGCVACEPRFYCQPLFGGDPNTLILGPEACIPSAKATVSESYRTIVCFGGTHCFHGDERKETWPQSVLSGAPIGGNIFDQTGLGGSAVPLELNATDPDGDALTFSVTALPAFGKLQYLNQDGKTWATMTQVPQVLPHPYLQLLSDKLDGGSPFASVTFVARDAMVASAPKVININLLCPEGTFLSQATRTCISCPPGTYQNMINSATQCIPCAINSAQVNRGATSCVPCQASLTFASTPGMSACRPCSNITSTAPGNLPGVLALSPTLCSFHAEQDAPAAVAGSTTIIDFSPLLLPSGVSVANARAFVKTVTQFGALHQLLDNGTVGEALIDYLYAPIDTLSQWVATVIATSDEHVPSRPSSSIVGPQKVFTSGSSSNSFAAFDADQGIGTIQLGYAQAVFITGISIYENIGGGAVTLVEAKKPDGTWVPLWTGVALVHGLQVMRIFQPSICPTNFPTNTVRITINSQVCKGRNEIDAVLLSGVVRLKNNHEIIVQNSRLKVAYVAPTLKSAGVTTGYQYTDTVSYEIRDCLTGSQVKLQGLQQLVVQLGGTAIRNEAIAAVLATASPVSVYLSILLSVIGIFGCIGSLAMLYEMENEPIVKAASVPFMSIMVVGMVAGFILLLLSALFEYNHSNIPGFCAIRPFILSIAFILLLGGTVVKTFRIVWIFETAMSGQKATRMKITNGKLMSAIFAMFVVDTIINLLWIALDPLIDTLVYDGTRSYYTCSGKSVAFQMVSVVYKACIILAGLFLAIKARNMPSTFNESRALGFMTYTVASQCLIYLVLSALVADNPSALLFVTCFSLIIALYSTWAILVGYKFFIVKFRPELNNVVTKVATAFPESFGGKSSSGSAGKTGVAGGSGKTGMSASAGGKPGAPGSFGKTSAGGSAGSAGNNGVASGSVRRIADNKPAALSTVPTVSDI